MRETRRVWIEAVVIAGVGVAVAMVANAANPDGLALWVNYFKFAGVPSGPRPPAAATSPSSAPQTQPDAALLDPEVEQAKIILQNNSIGFIAHDEMARLFHDPWYAQGMFLFVDAREADRYAAGHIPGAFHLYPFTKDEGLKQQAMNEVLQAVQGAEKVVVYCTGGHCDDSIQAAVDLREQGVDPGKLFVYVEGIHAWELAALPREKGARNSGDITEDGK